jgi:hypothetical protein
MSVTDSLLATILGALVVWLITTLVSHFVKKTRLRAALLADITINIAGAKEQRAAAAKLIENHVVEGHKLPFPIFYTVGEYLLYKSIQKDLPEYLSKAELVKVVKFYQALWELDATTNSLASTLGRWERDGIVLSKEQVAHAKRRKERIDSLCEVLSGKEIRKLSDLPDDYRSVKGPETVVANT